MGCRSGFPLLMRQLLLLLWKNFLLQIRRPIGTTFELLIPALAIIVIVGIRQIPAVRERQYTCPATFQSNYLDVPDVTCHRDNMTFYDDNTSDEGTTSEYPGTVFYTPNNNMTKDIMKVAEEKWPQLKNKLIPVDNQSEMIQNILTSHNPISLCFECGNGAAGVYFDKLNAEERDISYTLRFPYELDWRTGERVDTFISNEARTHSPYMANGFINLQRIIEESIIKYFSNGTAPDVVLSMRQFPYPDTEQDMFLQFLGFNLPLLVMLSFIYTCATITKELVLEKQTRIREYMLMMGLRQWILWTSWFIKQLIFMLIWVLAYTILFKVAGLWPRSDVVLLLIFFLLYVMSIIAFGFLLSVWFNSPVIGLIVGFVAFFINYVPALFIPFFYDRIPYGGKLALSLLSNTAFSLGVTVISNFEERQLGLQWTNAAEPLSIEDPLNMGAVYGMLICDIVLYMLIAWYVDAVKPGQYGIPKPLYFPFLPSYWTGKPRQSSKAAVESSTWHDPQAHEEEPRDLEAGIRIHNLTKIYNPILLALKWDMFQRGTRLAVDDLNLNMYEGQITALLGHNGAGKTTTMSILTGLYTPTAGTAVINGYDIRSNMDQIRRSLGICPQHNVLFDRLTVSEHLKFFAIMKGMSFKQAKGEVNSMLEDLQFQDKRNTVARNLSGGITRKLSVGIALIGGSKILVLDEPTSGMDPYARRSTWDLLIKHKEGRTMMLTTHSMDEADLLGDRIAIMAEGKLMCSGSSLFLKSRYGVGYHLTLVKGPSCDSREMSELVTSTVPGSQLAADVGAELTFILPFTSSQYFPVLLETLEEKRGSLGFSSFGLSLTTMEEVFMKVGTGSTETAEASSGTGYQRLSPASSTPEEERTSNMSQAVPDGDIELQEVVEQGGGDGTVVYKASNYKRHTGIILWVQQFNAMFVKRFYNSLRYYAAIFTQLFLPMIFIILSLLIVKIPDPLAGDDPKRVLTLSHSALSDRVEVFRAQFGEVPDDLVFNVTKTSIDVTKFDDITNSIQQIREAVVKNNHTELSDCCNYEYQLLDKFCSFQNPGDLRNACKNKDFAYKHCSKCLECSDASEDSPALSCRTHFGGEFCPAPPEIYIDYMLGSTGAPPLSGPLDSNNTFVAEYILREADRVEPSIYFQRAQAGFVFGYREPTELFCPDSSDPDDGIPNVPQFSEFNSGNLTATVWYNNQPFHTVAAALNTYHNILLRKVMKSDDWSITVYNHPLPRTVDTQADEEVADAFSGLAISILATFGFTFFISSFVIFPITEKESKAKHLQFVSGVNPVSYWLGNYAWDLVNAAIVVFISFCIFAAYQVDGYKGQSLGAVFFLMACTCFAGISICYCFSFLFKNHLSAYGFLFILFYFSALALQLTVLLVSSIKTRDIVHYISLLHPGYGLQIGLATIYISGSLESFCEGEYRDPGTCDRWYAENIYKFTFPGIGANLTYMVIEGLVLLLFVIFVEYFSSFSPSCVTTNRVMPEATSLEDNDVHNERVKVLGGPTNADDVVVIKNLSKVYRRRLNGTTIAPPKKAVNELCLSIPRGEVFGFVGVNGAGKTSTFSMLTGELSPSSGTAIIAGHDIRTSLRKGQQLIGYCPQFDGLIERMTGRELLTMFARLRGIPERNIKAVVTSTMQTMDLSKYANKLCRSYSGGNKRKLTTAIALIGDPPILLLDEPTTGMDPATRRYLWDVLTGIAREGRSIVLTTHSMEECEALCNRLAIMVNGEFKCLGSIQHLKSKFGTGYTLQAKVQVTTADIRASPTLDESAPRGTPPPPYVRSGASPPPYPDYGASLSPGTQPTVVERSAAVINLKAFIQKSFADAILLEEYQCSVTYQLPSSGLTWASVFGELEANKEELGIVDYSVSQTTLDQVFINFAKKQEGSVM